MTTTIYIVTPSFNAAETIDRTIHSVLSQAGDFRIRYHVQDGGSTDGTQGRIDAWRRRLRKGDFPCACHGIRLSCASEPDSGMYDALVRGFGGLDAMADDFMTWINADDILMPGALALAAALGRQFPKETLSWFGGAVCNLRDDMVTVNFDRPMPRAALRLGICDGTHWDFLQQEGTFFRHWLWRSVNPAATIAPMKLAGDWNLWRLMAAKAGFAQTSVALGGFRIAAGQLSATQRDRYLEEIDHVIPQAERRAAMETLCAAAPVTRRQIKAAKGGSTFIVTEDSAEGFAQHRWKTVFGAPPSWSKRQRPTERVIAEGRPLEHARVGTLAGAFRDIGPQVKASPGLIALDRDWQFPAITEKHAFDCMTMDRLRSGSDAVYVGYPWATLIDKLQGKARDADQQLDMFEQFCDLLPKEMTGVTVCQHIHARQFLHLFRQAGIRDVFWSHATAQDILEAAVQDGAAQDGDVRLHPFPLYPVQVARALPEAGPEHDPIPRRHLFSFIGARANQYYLTEARNWILDLLAADPRGLIVGRDGWHYQKVVYDLQVRGSATQAEAPALVDASASDQFRSSLLHSTFSLCPSGSGPNSIRLWESLGAGSIPVILADTWAPPGDPRLWEMAAVFCKETPEAIRALPDRLAEIAADPARLARMRHAMRQLWLLYGPDSFVTDVQAFLLSRTPAPAAVPQADDHLSAALALGEGCRLLQACCGALLLDPAATQGRIAADAALAAALRKARAELPEGAALARHYDAVCAHAARTPAAPAAPARQRGAAPKLCFFGRHAKRTPLSYAPIRRLLGDRLDIVERPDAADILVTGFNLDLRENIDTLRPLLTAPKAPKIVVLSEEPLWDITWSGPFTGCDGKMSVKGIGLSYAFLGHETSDIYAFDRIPYFVLTSETYAVRYANMMGRFAHVSPAMLLDRWNRAPIRAAFFAEHRKGEAYAGRFPERDVAALSAYRTELAEAAQGDGVLRVGKGWGAETLRQDLPDWHLDKLAQLDGRTRVLSSLENVHQRLYISEKIFDAFAVGAIPAYWAGPNHRIFDLVPAAAMVNCHGLDPQAAAERIAALAPDAAFAEAWLDTCSRLARLFGNAQAIQAERRRVAEAALAAVLAVA
ncbi:MAG: exostosin family protein [Pararhodobacter sp.]